MNKGEVKPLTSGERASISKFHIFVTKTMLVFSTNYLLEEDYRDFSLERWGISALSSIPPQMDRAEPY